MVPGVRKILSLMALVTTIVTLISCSAANNKSEEKSKNTDTGLPSVKLRFVSSWGGVDSKADILQQVLDRFMEDNPQIEVINESMFGDDFLPKIKTDFASGNDPDVFGIWPGSDIRALVKAGKVADLTELLNSDSGWEQSFKKSGWAYTTYNGRIYGLPLEIIYEALFINKDLFNENGIKVPETYEELKQAVIAFRAKGIIPVAYNSSAEGTYLYQNIISVLGGKEGVENAFADGKVNRCYVDAIKYVKELYNLGAFPKDAFTITSKERNNLFKNKKAAMIVQGSWFIGDIKEIEESVDIIPFPWIEKKESHPNALIYGLGCGSFQISRKAWDNDEKKAASIKLLKALTSRETAALMAKQTGMLSNVEIDERESNYGVLVRNGQEMIENAKELIGPPDSFVDRAEWEKVIVKEFPYVLEGRIEAEALWEKVMKKSQDNV